MNLLDEGDVDLFWSKVDIKGQDECWEWKARIGTTGYGQCTTAGQRKVHGSAHRMAYYLANGDIPEGMFVCHTCDNKKCCNPTHLWLGTNKENIEDHYSKGKGTIGTNNGMSVLSKEQIAHVRMSKRPVSELAETHGVSEPTIYRLKRGETYQNVN